MVFVATPVVALLKCFDVQKENKLDITKPSKISKKPGKGTSDAHHAGHTPGAR
jgi:hypothetical protein